MKDIPTTFGIPDTLPPLGLRELWGCIWFGVTGLALLLLGLFPNLHPPPWAGLLLLVCWLALPARGVFRQFARKSRPDDQKHASGQVKLYTVVVVSFGVGFTLWARQLSLPWPIVIGALFLIEGLSTLIAALTEWWRLSMVGLSAGLMICGFAIPFVDNSRVLVLVGGAVSVGSLLSAGILYGQWRYHEACSAACRSLQNNAEPAAPADGGRDSGFTAFTDSQRGRRC